MADGFKVSFQGGTKFEDMLAKLPERIENKILQKSVNEAMKIGFKAVRAAAPVHTAFQSAASKRYGTLKKNIKVRPSKSNATKGQRAAYITTGDAFWGFLYEKGSRHQPARPWFFPAFQSSVSAIIKQLGDSLGKGIENEAQK